MRSEICEDGFTAVRAHNESEPNRLYLSQRGRTIGVKIKPKDEPQKRYKTQRSVRYRK